MVKVDIKKVLKSCIICPRACGVDRTSSRDGFCRARDFIEVHAAQLHMGEEPLISGSRGSGTIFFNHCNLRCVYCQNYKFSQVDNGKEYDALSLAALMLNLQKRGAHNINFVTPTHYAFNIIESVRIARTKGLKIPIVYNTSGYEKIETLKLLDGIVDIYLTDMRYASDIQSKDYSQVSDYVSINREAVKEMYRQAGFLRISRNGVAEKGLIVRHLILPNRVSGADGVFKFLSEEFGGNVHVSLMSQYYPAYKGGESPSLCRSITRAEYKEAVTLLNKYDLKYGWTQDYLARGLDQGFAGTNIGTNV